MTPPSTPYKGLRFYTSDDSSIFAARDFDARRCLQLLTGPSAVLMLHGRTGCGKSSFLHAALKPLLESTDTGLWFAGASQTFIVVRSGLTPLRQLAGAIFDAAQHLKDPRHASGRNLDDVLREYQNKEQRSDFINYYSDRVERMLDALSGLGEAASGTPVLVIDQAEEVFTLRDKVDRGASGTALPPSTSARDVEDAIRARVDYMNVLRTIAAQPPGVKILISLRTEYKGLFEDELRRGMSAEASTRLTGFHLNELDFDGLVKAIVSPTKVPAPDGRGSFYRFRYDKHEEVPREIARRLLDTDAVPMGGVLPTLQVVCSRLYEQTRLSKRRGPDDEWEIQMTDLERLGKLDDQVAVYLREQLEEMFRKRSSAEIEEIDRTKDIDQWYRLLEHLVRLQGDGRAVTRQLPKSELWDIGEKKLKCRLFGESSLEHLETVGILRHEDRERTTFWTLGHDSVGLAIHKWAITYKEWITPTMRMDINSPRNAARLSRDELFPGDALLEGVIEPATFRIKVPADLLWDHQIPFFAHTRRLSERLGILFDRDAGLVPTADTRSPRILVSADRPLDRSSWTDVAVSNLFQGNGLVGPIVEVYDPEKGRPVQLQSLRTVEAGDDLPTAQELANRLGRILDHLVKVDATVLAYDASTRSLLELAAHLAGRRPEDVSRLVKDDVRPSHMSSKEELFERLVKAGHNEDTFMVGTAYGRALASHRGYTTYFDCQDLSRFIDILEKLKGNRDLEVLKDLESRPESRSELFRLYKNVFSHTVWQVNIPSADWRRIEHYPMVMRLAALCYFTADYIRSFPDDFVRHLYDWHANTFEAEDRVSRETIREMLQDCFQFLTFDENPRLLFDPDSKFEFSPRHGDVKLSSTVTTIHAELTACRKRTVDVFRQMCEQLDQLEPHGKNSRGDEKLRKAETLRGYAWANFRIYNYYDSARLMEQAMRLVAAVVATTTRQLWDEPVAQGTPRLKTV